MRIWMLILMVSIACQESHREKYVYRSTALDTITADVPANNKVVKTDTNSLNQTGKVTPQQLVAFATSLTGTPYLYASSDPNKGFDCSGFITYVFNHFHITVPRSSVQFTNYGKEVSLSTAKPGDLILFTGTDSTIRVVGHMGIITVAGDTIYFIHSTSGKAQGVTITPLNEYYMGRFVKVIRVFR